MFPSWERIYDSALTPHASPDTPGGVGFGANGGGLRVEERVSLRVLGAFQEAVGQSERGG